MTRKESGRRAAIMQAYADGKKIEKMNRRYTYWEDDSYPDFDWYFNDYRIKPEPEYVPFDFSDAEKLIGKAVKTIGGSTWTGLILNVNENYVIISDHPFDRVVDHNSLLKYYIFYPSGSPCGKEKA